VLNNNTLHAHVLSSVHSMMEDTAWTLGHNYTISIIPLVTSAS